MFYCIEKKEQLDSLKKSGDCFIHFIPTNNNIHPQLNSLSLIYLRYLNTHKGYILCLKHNEAFGLEYDDILNYLKNNAGKIFVSNKKDSMYYFPFSNKLYDVNFLSPIEDNINIECISWYYKHIKYKEINCLIPISKHYEYCELLFKQLKGKIKLYNEEDEKYKFNNTTLTDIFYQIENKGIKLNKEKYIQYYSEIQNPENNIQNGVIYTSYNLYTLTGRPSNSFNSINFAALSKSNNERETFIPRNDWFVEFDFDGYHPRLIGNKVGYEFNLDDSVHNQLGKLYFEKDIIDDEEYKKSKDITFQQLYGGIRNEYKDNPFFTKVSEFIKQLWDNINDNGFIETPNKIFYINQVEKPSPQKLFNYLIQNLETYNNILVLKEILSYLKTKKTKLVLYTYDAFLFDYSIEDGQECLHEIQKIMKYPSKIKFGKNYNELKKI